MFGYLDEFKKDPVNSQPYLIITMFDEMVHKKGLAFVRGDIVTGFSKQESTILQDMFIDHYLKDHLFEKVNKFNHSPNEFDFETYTRDALLDFRMRKLDTTTTL